MRAKLFSDARAMVAAAEEDKNAVTVSHKEGIDFGVIGPDDSVYIDITVLKTGFRSHIVLETISIRAENSKSVSAKLTHSFSHISAAQVYRNFGGKIEMGEARRSANAFC
jgi:hypothetical protein